MEINERLLEKIQKDDETIKESKQIEEKLANSDVPEGKKEKLRYRHRVLEKKLKKTQNDIYL
jgi:hypothetical protein